MIVFVTKKGQAGSLCDNNQLKVQRAAEQRALALLLQKQKVGGDGPGDGVERLMGNLGYRHLAQDAQNRQKEGRGIRSQLLRVSLALYFLSTIGLFVQGNTHTQTRD